MSSNGSDAEFEVVYDVPLPSGRRSKYPFSTMKEGGSFGPASKNVASAAAAYKRKHPEFTYQVGPDPKGGGVRVWRRADDPNSPGSPKA